MLHGSVTEMSGERLCFAKSAVEVLGVHPEFACTWRILRANELKIAQGSSLARISLAVAIVKWVWVVETLQVILLGARRFGTGQVVVHAGRR